MYAGIATGFACTGTPGKATIVEKYTPDKIVGDILLELPKAALLPIWTAMQFDRIVAREDRGTVYQVGAWAVGFTAGLMVFLPAVVGQVAWEGLQKDVNEFRYGYTFFGSVEVREPRPDTSEQELMPTKQP